MNRNIYLFVALLFITTLSFGQKENKGKNNPGQTNTSKGKDAGTNGENNSFYGYKTGKNNSGLRNTFIGSNAGQLNLQGRRNVFVGAGAGKNSLGNRNVFIGHNAGANETGNQKLYISNSDTATPLIYGDFSTGQLGINTTNLLGNYRLNVGGGGYFDGNSYIQGSLGTDGDILSDNGSLVIESGNISAQEGKITANELQVTESTNFVTTNNSDGGYVRIGSFRDPNNIGFHNFYVGADDGPGYDIYKNRKLRFRAQFSHTDYQSEYTKIFYADKKGDPIFNLEKINDTEGYTAVPLRDVALSLPQDASRFVIGAKKDYKLGNKLVVANGNALVEGNVSSTYGAAFGTNSIFTEDVEDVSHIGELLKLGPDANFRWDREIWDDETGVYHRVSDLRGTSRHEAVYELASTTVKYNNRKGENIFSLKSDDGLDDIPRLVLPIANSSVSIGTDKRDPGYALTVKGKMHAQELKVDLKGAIMPDYVFTTDYDLRTLEEVQNYIKKEGHLPNIPSAEEVAEEGINLKEMNLKLLEKIEELTLYTIAQEKKIKSQEAANQKLESTTNTLAARLAKIEALLSKTTK